MLKKFYENLYREDRNIDHDNNNFLTSEDAKLSEDEKLTCEGPIKEYECLEALTDMKNMKSPGSDGLTAEFYKLFWTEIKIHYINSINYSFEHQTLTETGRNKE